MTLDDVSQRGLVVQTETVQEDEELEDVDFCEGYLNEIDSWSRIFELSHE
jgi:hypothetical protein